MTTPSSPTAPRFFASPAEFRAWLEAHHESAALLWVGFHKRGTGRPSLTWPESVDEALCFGWIDGVRKRVDDESYTIRFTPRRPQSNWSAVNTKRMQELVAAGRVTPAGLAAFERRVVRRSASYSYEQRHSAELGTELEARFRARKVAWTYFEAQARWYRQLTTWWVVSAKRPETRERRFAQLVECCARRRPLPGLDRTRGKP